MRVLHLRSGDGIYGAERVILTLARAQQHQGIGAEVACLERPGRHAFSERLRADGIPSHPLPTAGRLDWNTLRALVRLIDDRVRPDVVHAHDYKTDLYLAAVRPFLRRRVAAVATNHLWTHETPTLALYERLDALAVRALDRVVGVSEAIRGELLAAGVPASKVNVIQNGLDYSELGGAKRGALLRAVPGSTEASRFVGFVGRLSVQKGLPFLLEASERLVERPDVHVVLVGEGPLRAEVQARISDRGLEGRVHLLGRRDDVADLLHEMHLMVLPSLREGTPMVLLEAMGVGCPVVAAAVGGVKDVVEDRRTGRVVPPSDVPALTRAIEDLLDHPEERERLGLAGRAAARSRFSGEVMARRYAELYSEVA